MPKARLQKKGASTPSYQVPALEKGLRILEDLAGHPSPLSLAELAESQGKSRNELFRMLNCLERLGYVAREAVSGKYQLSLKLHYLAQRQPLLARLRSAAELPMQALAEQLGESCHLCVLDGSRLAVVLQAQSSQRVHLHFNLSMTFDPAQTCSGLLLLSRESPERREALLAPSNHYQSLSPTGRKRLRRSLSKLEQESSFHLPSHEIKGVMLHSALVGSTDTLLAALAVPSLQLKPTAQEDRKLVQALTACTADINRQLGVSPPE